MDPLTSGGTRLQPARFHFQPAWFPTLAKPADKQNAGESERREATQDDIADIFWGVGESHRRCRLCSTDVSVCCLNSLGSRGLWGQICT